MYKLYHGKETFLSHKAAQKEIERVSKEGFDPFFVDASSKEADEILALFTSNNMFSPKRAILIKRLYSNKQKDAIVPEILKIASESEPTSVFIFWEDQKISSITKYLKFFKELNSVEEFEELKKNQFGKWAREYIERNEIDVDNDILNIICERTNYSTERFAQEMEKVQIGEIRITHENISEIVPDTFQSDIWKLTDMINQSNKADSLKILENLLAQQLDPHFILAMVSRNLRLSILVKYLRDKGLKGAQIASALKIPPFTIPGILGSVENKTFDRLKKMYAKLSNLDLLTKTGEIEPILGLTLLIARI